MLTHQSLPRIQQDVSVADPSKVEIFLSIHYITLIFPPVPSSWRLPSSSNFHTVVTPSHWRRPSHISSHLRPPYQLENAHSKCNAIKMVFQNALRQCNSSIVSLCLLPILHHRLRLVVVLNPSPLQQRTFIPLPTTVTQPVAQPLHRQPPTTPLH